MSKEEILQEKDREYWNHEVEDMPLLDQMYSEYTCLEAMDLHAEKVAVAFAEWKEENVFLLIPNTYFLKSDPDITFKSNSDLYQYFINNVYNK